MAFDNRTFENLQEEMMDEADGVDESEGSLVAISLAKHAVRMEEGYAQLSAVNDNLLCDTMDLEHLIASGAECGVPYKEGTPAVVLAYTNCPVAEGDTFTASDSDYDYTVVAVTDGTITDDDGAEWYQSQLEAMDNGTEPGQYTGLIEPIEVIDGFEDGKIVSLVTPGTDDEDEEIYRERRINAFSTRACAGNRAYYNEVIKDNFPVRAVKSFRRVTGQAYIDVYILDYDYGVPSQSLIDTVQEGVDPTDYSGEGVGLAPMGSIVHISGPEGVTIDVAASYTFDDDYSYAALETQIEDAIKAYLLQLRQTWQDSSGMIVRITGIETAILKIEGILDIADVTINNAQTNLPLTELQVPVFGSSSEVVPNG